MVKELKAAERETLRASVLGEWAEAHGVDLSRFDLGQQWVIFFALQVVTHLGKVVGLKRVVGYFLAASRMDLGSTVIGAIIGCAPF